jgi:hypothetical protein
MLEYDESWLSGITNSTKNAKNDILGITDILPCFSPYWSPITSFHHIRHPRYYRDILESVTGLMPRMGADA